MAGNEVAADRQAGLAAAAQWLDRFLLPLVLVCAGLGIALPGPGRRLDASGAIFITLAVLVFCTGASVTFADFRGLRTASRRMALMLAATTIVLPPVFDWLQREGAVSMPEMWRTFNCGVGFVVITAAADVDAVTSDLDRMELSHRAIGRVVAAGDGDRVRIG